MGRLQDEDHPGPDALQYVIRTLCRGLLLIWLELGLFSKSVVE